MTLDGLAPDAAEIESVERVKPPRPGRNETVPIDRIIFGERRRQEMGDIDALAGSIGRYGLLQPIVVDDEWRLVAGGRRLEACRRLGWAAIPTRAFADLSERERQEIEAVITPAQQETMRSCQEGRNGGHVGGGHIGGGHGGPCGEMPLGHKPNPQHGEDEAPPNGTAKPN